jgi:hypothetical protein
MKVYKIVLCIVDHDVGGDEISAILENAHYPNHCIGPKVISLESREIGEWHDDHPLNERNSRAAFESLFGNSSQG